MEISPVVDHRAMLGRGDRNEMRAACLLRFKTKPEVEYEGSDHMGAQADPPPKPSSRQESLFDLNKVVALHPKPGELKYQKRQSKEDSELIIEESYKASSEKQSLLMVVASISSPPTIVLTKNEAG